MVFNIFVTVEVCFAIAQKCESFSLFEQGYPSRLFKLKYKALKTIFLLRLTPPFMVVTTSKLSELLCIVEWPPKEL